MSAIRERTSLCVVELPKKLSSERNLLAHFSKFGEVQNVAVNKELRTGLIQFCNHFHAQSAKTQGSAYEGTPLKLFWSESALDPRARIKQEYSVPDSGQLWQDDEKECFGVETVQKRMKKKQVHSFLIKQHLKLSDIRKKGTPINIGKDAKSGAVALIKSPLKTTKAGTKLALRELKFGKKNLLMLDKKQKTIQKKISTPSFITVKQTPEEQNPVLSATSMFEQTNIQHMLSLLDERDKSIRKKTVADSNIKTAVAIKGTCKDMCPERERLSRQCGHAIAYYEMIPGTNVMDENRAVKEYTRSSADQEVPLPHSLRPEPVLSMTMNYLITNIISRVDNPEENKALWYSFCWNRLRSVRKDIILQQLCDMETVKIVEQCARFHISCYDHMSGADVSGFDDKINTQILIDCLQTLRHMYEDLAQQSISCPNEAEFYSYLILLKLKTGDIIWEYQQYSLDIQLSHQVQFAIEAYMAFKNNMYAKYFNLVKKASYLTACLMQRYFDLVRTQAIKTMVKAYCLPGKAIGLSSSFVVSSLCFDSHEHALKFSGSEGVRLRFDGTDDETSGYVSSSSFLIREKRLPIANAVVGENNPLPVYIPHEVNSSFDEFGNLKSSFLTIENENEDDSLITSEEIPLMQDEKSEVNIQEDNKAAFKFSLSPTKIEEPFFGKDVSSFKFMPTNKSVHHTILLDENNIMNNQTNEKMSTMDHESIEAAFQNNKVNFASKNISFSKNTYMPDTPPSTSNQTKIQKPFSFSFSPPPNESSLTFNCVESEPMLTDVRTSKLKNNENLFSLVAANTQAVNNLPQIFLSANTESHGNRVTGYNGLKSSVTTDQSETWSKEIISLLKQDTAFQNVVEKQRESVTKTNQLNNLLDINNSKEFEYEMAMKEAAVEKQRMEEERIIENEKIRLKIEEQKTLHNLRKYVGKRLKAINARKCGRQWKSRVEHLKKTRADFPMLVHLPINKHLKLWGTIDYIPVNSVYQRIKNQRNSSTVISQLLLSGITESCKYIGSSVAEELAKSAAKRMKSGVVRPVYWKLAISLPGSDDPSSELSVFNQLMRKWCKQAFYKNLNTSLGSVESLITSLQIPVNICVSFIDSIESAHGLESLDALVFVVLSQPESERDCIQRLETLVSRQGKHSNFSVAVMNISSYKLERVLKMQLEKLHEQNLIQHWTVNPWLSPNSIIESLNFLTKHVNVASHILSTSLKLLVEQVTEEFFDALSSGLHWCNGLKEAVKNPNNVISLYNTFLTKLEDLLLSSKLENYFGFGKEFQIYIPLDESGGPELMCGKQYSDVYKIHISKKVNSLKLPEFTKWPPTSVNRLAKILKAYCCEIHDPCIFPQIIRMLDLPDDVDVRKHVEQVCWLNVVEIWAQCNIRQIFSFGEKSTKMLVMYNENDLHRILKTQWWIKLSMVTQFNK